MPINRIKGTHQFTDVITENIRNYAVTAIKLNPDIAGNGITLDENNRISFTGLTIVKTTAELIDAINLGVANNLLLKEGQYNIGTSLILNRPISLIGENKKTTLISLSPSGQINASPSNLSVISGTATLTSENVVVVSNLSVSGQLGTTQYNLWEGSSMIFDDVPYKVVKVIGAESGGVATLQLSEPYAATSFVNKPFKLEYLLDYFVLQNLGIASAYNDGIVKVNQVRNVVIDNVELKGLDVVNSPSQGFNINESYYGIVSNSDVTLTRATLPLTENKEYALLLSKSHFFNINNLNIRNTNSNGVYLYCDSYISLQELKVFNIDGNPFRVYGSSSIEILASNIREFGLKGTIVNSEQILLTGNNISNSTDTQAFEIDESHVNLINNNFLNSYVKIFNTTKEVIISSNEFENLTATNTSLYIQGGDRSIINGNIFNNIATNSLFVFSGDVIVSNNNFTNTTTAINIQNSTQAVITNNNIDNSVNGIILDSTITNANIGTNTAKVSNVAFAIPGIGNFVSNNVAISGIINIVVGNYSNTTSDIRPYNNGLLDIGSLSNNFKDLYLSSSVRSKNVILNDGAVFGAINLNLNGNNITSDSSHIYINGNDLAGLSLNDIQYVHNQVLATTSWTVRHNLKTKNVSVFIYDIYDNAVEPDTISNIDANNLLVTFTTDVAGRAIVHSAGTKSNNVGSNAGVAFNYTQNTPASVWTINHNLSTQNLIVQTYDSSNEAFIPSTIRFIDNNTVQVFNAYAKAGRAVVLSEYAVNALPVQMVFTQGASGNIWNIPHNRGSTDFGVTTFDAAGNVFIPNNITIIDSNNVNIYVDPINGPYTGKAVLLFASTNSQSYVDVKYVHTQVTASSTWSVLHNLHSSNISVSVYDSLGLQISQDQMTVDVSSPDITTISFKAGVGAKAGTAVIFAPLDSSILTNATNNIGNLGNLNTSDKTSLVNAVNETYSFITTNDINKNKIINGDFLISDEYSDTGAIIPSNTTTYVGDVFKLSNYTSGLISWERSTVVPPAVTVNASQHSLKINILSGAIMGLTDYFKLSIPIEGYRIADSFDNPTTLSFYVKTSHTGIFTATFKGSFGSYPAISTYLSPFAIGSYDWQLVQMTIPADANFATYNNTNGLGLEIDLMFSAGANLITTVGDSVWYMDSLNEYRSYGQDTDLSVYTSGFIYITRMKYEKGSKPTGFVPSDYIEERRKIDRYYQILSSKNQVVTYSGVANDSLLTIPHRVEMRTNPTTDVRHLMVSGSAWLSGTVTQDTANQYNTSLLVSHPYAYRFVGGDGSYDGTHNFVIHNKARF